MLHYTESGTGTPLILLHGFLSSHTYWDNVLPELEKHYRVIAIDLLGFGDSPKPASSDYSLHAHSAAIRETIDSILGSNTPFIMVGHSMGAMIACQIAAQATNGTISHLVLCNMPLFSSAQQARTAFAQSGAAYRYGFYSRFGRLLWRLLTVSMKLALLQRIAYFCRPSLEDLTRNTEASRTRSLKNTLETVDGVVLLNSVTVPTQIIVGTYDRLCPAKNIRRIETNTQRVMIKTATGHHTIQTEPEHLFRALSR